MIAEELINYMIPPIKPGDEAHKAITWMEELRVNQLPVVDKGIFLGLIHEDTIYEDNRIDREVRDFDLIGSDCYVLGSQHFYDIIKTATNCSVQMVAVFDDDNTYLGVITVEDTITAFAQTAAVQSSGGIIVLSMAHNDYSLSEISRLVEGEGAKILSSSVANDTLDPTKFKLTLKINKVDLSHIIATLERFGYKIIARFQESEAISNEKERIDILLRYLDI
ncbi:CBS domain-containing protein [Roseivirga sp. BDSF3-8]|uniref:CBS domain-containing protein n=1 Tax=Roseivirga sp. BDSF3-8 TaxID=3241598 RepID=UPI0035318D42